MTAPIIKWVGGKTALLPELVKRLPKRYRMYYEPFIGGAALFFHQRPPRAILNDANVDLVNLYHAVAREPDKVIRSLSQMSWRHNQRYYEQIRREWNRPSRRAKTSLPRQAAMFMYLNKTCFNGLWRVNSSGAFNVPMGSYKLERNLCDASAIKAASAALHSAIIRCGDYWSACSEARDGDFVYLDPPYDPVSASSNFTAYTKDGFDRDAQIRLATRASELVKNGAQVMLSNADTKLIRSIYRTLGFRLHKVTAPRAINSNGKKRGHVPELIITGGY